MLLKAFLWVSFQGRCRAGPRRGAGVGVGAVGEGLAWQEK